MNYLLHFCLAQLNAVSGASKNCSFSAGYFSGLFFAGALASASTAAGAQEHWAFKAPQPTSPPAVQQAEWPLTPVDHFILQKLESAHLEPSSPADPRVLIRRISYGLRGLPPSLEEVNAFVQAAARDRQLAIGQWIDRFLADPRYGEHWGRYWLDLARYSNTKGYVYGREEPKFVHAPAYRDWVIAAFNKDLPYDQFLMLQIAGDQMVGSGSPDLAAMGFITGGRRFIGVTHEIIDDRIDVVTRGALGLTVQCARCHDHKYDPISIQDYYSLYGVFQASEERLIPLVSTDDPELAKRKEKLLSTMTKRREEAAARLRSRVADYLKAQLELSNYPEEGFDQILTSEDIIPASVRRWRDYLLRVKDPAHPIFAPWYLFLSLSEQELKNGTAPLQDLLKHPNLNPLVRSAFQTAPGSMAEVATRYGQLFAAAEAHPEKDGAAELLAFLANPDSPTVIPDTGIVNNELFFPTSICEELWKLQGEVDRRMLDLGLPAALVLADRSQAPNPRVFKRGSPSQLGEEVPRQFLKALAGEKRTPFQQGSGRLELARAIVDPNNPLTARVMVNRIWQHHFGQGLVRTASDFGLRAEDPSHPELLDWLALRFIESGWSVKTIHRMLLSSAVYQTSAAAPSDKDPENRFLAHFPLRRLSFEQLRDSMLQVSGELDFTQGGKPRGVLESGNHQRTVYSFVDRQFLPGVLRTFDFANPDIHVAIRHETTVPQQGLFFLNGPFAAERAKTLVRTLRSTEPEERIRELHQSIFQRPPNAWEVLAAHRFLADAEAIQPPPHPRTRETPWRYGWGEYDDGEKKLKGFQLLPYFTGLAWQGAAEFPGGETGWAQLTAEGGHPGNTLSHGCVRRWIAPREMTVSISGTLIHEPEAGDGIRAFIVTSRQGELKRAMVHKSRVEMAVSEVSVLQGDTIDFIVDIGGTLNSDQFLWVPVIQTEGETWNAREDFGGPISVPMFLNPWEQYAQVLFLSNELAFAE